MQYFSFDVTKFMIWTFPQGMDLEEFPPLLSLGFSSPTVDNEEPLSFGTLLACLNMALSNLGPVSFGYFYDVCACSHGSSTTSFSFCHVVVPNQSCGSSTLFLCEHFLLPCCCTKPILWEFNSFLV